MSAGTAMAGTDPWHIGLTPSASPVMDAASALFGGLFGAFAAVFLIVAALLLFAVVRFHHRIHPVPDRAQSNKLLEVVLIVMPAIALVAIAVPAIGLLKLENDIPQADVVVQAVGHQWYWSYSYPNEGGLQFNSTMLPDAVAARSGEPRLLGVDNPIYVPVDQVVEIVVTGADVVHSWTVPALGVKIDAVPGRLNRTWFKATKTGIYYGQCSQGCGTSHGYMPVEVRVVTEDQYDAWLVQARLFYAGGPSARMASR